MKILFLEWKSFANDFILKAFKVTGIEPVLFTWPREEEDTRRGEGLAEKLVQSILSDKYEFVFSFNYFPVAAMACKASRIKYVSWVYDSPFIQLYSQTVFYETNRIFIFDKGTCIDLLNKGVKHVYYLPMAADTAYYDGVIQEAMIPKRYRTDISFVGSLYSETKHQLFRHLDELDQYTKGYLDAVMQAQKMVYGQMFLEECLTPEIVRSMQTVCPIYAQGDGIESAEWVFANYFLARKVTAMERNEIMELLSKDFSLSLFTGESTPHLKNLRNQGKVDYYSEAPLVFNNSKINLNISLRSILTGIPLRAFDIMGCGGFLLTNYQADYLDLFTPGEDFVFYESQEDLVDKVSYYLEHDNQRRQIAENGYHKVKAAHTYEHRVEEMLQTVF